MQANVTLQIPQRLSPGDIIGVVAPAGAFKPQALDAGIAFLEAAGFRVRCPENLQHQKGYLAGSDTHRAALLQAMLTDPDINAVMCVRGGFGCMRVLPLLDFDAIAQQPKIIVGYSDISALLAAIAQRAGFVTYHGPVVAELGYANDATRSAFLNLMTNSKGYALRPSNGVTVQGGQVRGLVTGGNLTTLCHLVGTPYAPRLDGCIVALEDHQEATYRIDRMLTQMKLSGVLDGVAGLVLGTFKNCGPLDMIIKIVRNIFKGRSLPILAGFDFGHGATNIAFPVGLSATLDADRQHLVYD